MSLIRDLTDDAIVETKNDAALIKPAFLSHGTLEVRDLLKTRLFYEEFLGLECVQHAPQSMAIRCGMKFHIIALQVGDAIYPMRSHNHWGLDVGSREEVDRAHETALAARNEYDVLDVTDPVDTHGVYSFMVQDRDSNWWEVQYYEAGLQDDDIFDFGDRFKPDGTRV